jgi:hypothetical protein
VTLKSAAGARIKPTRTRTKPGLIVPLYVRRAREVPAAMQERIRSVRVLAAPIVLFRLKCVPALHHSLRLQLAPVFDRSNMKFIKTLLRYFFPYLTIAEMGANAAILLRILHAINSSSNQLPFRGAKKSRALITTCEVDVNLL